MSNEKFKENPTLQLNFMKLTLSLVEITLKATNRQVKFDKIKLFL